MTVSGWWDLFNHPVFAILTTLGRVVFLTVMILVLRLLLRASRLREMTNQKTGRVNGGQRMLKAFASFVRWNIVVLGFTTSVELWVYFDAFFYDMDHTNRVAVALFNLRFVALGAASVVGWRFYKLLAKDGQAIPMTRESERRWPIGK